MKEKNELSYRDLKMVCDQKMFKFETTKELEPINDGIGQERGIKALEFGINVDVKGYNLYIEGPSGVGKTMYTKNYLDGISSKKKVPNDWCYIYNFQNPNEPIAVSLPAGQGKEFKESMEGFIKEVKKDIKKTFNADDFEKEKALIKKEFEEKREVVLTKLNEDSQKHGFQVKSAQNGIYMMPVVEGKVIQEEEFDKLDEEIKKQYEEKSVIVQQQIMDAISVIKQIERQSDKKVSEWQSNVALLTVNAHINYIKSKYKRNKKITQFLNDVKQDVLKNVSYFLEEDERRTLAEFEMYKTQQKQIEKMKESIKKLREFGRLAGNEMFFKRAKSIKKRLEKRVDKKLPIKITSCSKSGKDILVIKNLNKCYGDKIIFKNFNMEVFGGEKVQLKGKN